MKRYGDSLKKNLGQSRQFQLLWLLTNYCVLYLLYLPECSLDD